MSRNRIDTDGSSSTTDPLVEEGELARDREMGGDVTPPYLTRNKRVQSVHQVLNAGESGFHMDE